MFVKEVKKPNGSTAILIVESIRKNGKVTHKTIRSLGQHKDPIELETIRKAAQELIIVMKEAKQPVLPGLSPSDVYGPIKRRQVIGDFKVDPLKLKEEDRVINGVQEAFGVIYEQLNFNEILKTDYKQDEWNFALRQCVLSRIADPSSKLKTSKNLVDYFSINLPVGRIYRMMDKVHENESNIKSHILTTTETILKQSIDVLFYDVTTLYFESFEEDELRKFGFSKDCKFKETQIVLALQTTHDGLPIGYELFPGNTYEGHTLIESLEKMKEKFDLRRVVIVADRAMFNNENLQKMEAMGVQYVVAAKLKSLSKPTKEEILKFSENQLKQKLTPWSNSWIIDGRRLIVDYTVKRAQKDQADRKRLIERLKKKEKNNKIQLTDLIHNRGTRKYLNVDKGSHQAVINEEKIKESERWDGLHGVITNVMDRTNEELLERYKNLWQIEAAFRLNKSDLQMRPIFHWKAKRIKAHIAICYMAYAVSVYMKYRLKKSGLNMSLEKIKAELFRVQKSIIKDTESRLKFVLPSKTNQTQEEIYKSLDLEICQTPYFI